jgi:hypothetical protein
LWVIFFYGIINFLINILQYKEFFSPQIDFFFFAAFTFFEYLFFTYFLYLEIKSKTFKRILAYTSCLFILFLLFYNLNAEVRGIDSVPIGIETILIMLFSFRYLYEQMNDTTTLFVYSKPSFWIILGFLIYLSGSFFIYIFANQSREAIKFWYLTNVFSILKTVLFSIAILLNKKTKSKPKIIAFQ